MPRRPTLQPKHEIISLLVVLQILVYMTVLFIVKLEYLAKMGEVFGEAMTYKPLSPLGHGLYQRPCYLLQLCELSKHVIHIAVHLLQTQHRELLICTQLS